jgi:hypothetical protein
VIFNAEISEMRADEASTILGIEIEVVWRIRRCMHADQDSLKQPWERTGGVPLAARDWDLLETEWDPAQGCRTSASPCACQKAAMAGTSAESEFACRVLVSEGIDAASEVVVAECLTNLGYPSAVAFKVKTLLRENHGSDNLEKSVHPFLWSKA